MYTYETDPNLRDIARAGVRAEQDTGFPAVAMLAQWAAESKWGESLTGDYNYWGIKHYPTAGKSDAKFCPTWEDCTTAGFALFRADERASVTKVEMIGNGICRYHMSCWFASYASFDEGVHGYIKFLHDNSRYHTALAQYVVDKDLDALLKGIAKAGWADGAGYANLLLTLEHQNNIRHAVDQARKDLGINVEIVT